MPKCIECAFLIRETSKSNYICSIEKIRHPGTPGFYIKNPNSLACMSNFRKCTNSKKEKE